MAGLYRVDDHYPVMSYMMNNNAKIEKSLNWLLILIKKLDML